MCIHTHKSSEDKLEVLVLSDDRTQVSGMVHGVGYLLSHLTCLRGSFLSLHNHSVHTSDTESYSCSEDLNRAHVHEVMSNRDE